MLSKAFSTAAVALAAGTLVSAQTFSDCDPTKRTDCDPNAAYGSDSVDCDLTKGECDGFHEFEGTTIEYESQGALFRIAQESNAPTVGSDYYIFFGRLEVELEAAPGQGIVTSIVLQSDCLDEIDWEWVGGDVDQVQSNYYRKGDTTTYDRVEYHELPGAVGDSKLYVIDWTPERIQWIVDGNVIRTLTASAAGSNYPQTPMQIRLGTWVGGGKDSPEGTVEWAGGYADFSDAPFDSWYKSIKVVDYAGGNSAADFAVRQYSYGDKSGTKDSIVVEKGEGGADKPTATGSVIEPERPERPERTSTKEEESKTRSVIEPETSTEAHTTTVSPPATTSSTVVTPEPSTTSEEAPTSTDDNDDSEETDGADGNDEGDDDAAEVPEGAASSMAVGFATFAVAGAAILAQLF